MKAREFKQFRENLTEISRMPEDIRDAHMKILMSAGFLWLELTDKQVDIIKEQLLKDFPDECIVHEADEHGFTMDFRYIRFK